LINIPKLFENHASKNILDKSPSFLITYDSPPMLSVYNKSNDKILDIFYNSNTIGKIHNNEADLNLKYSQLSDLDSDRKNEIVSDIPNLGLSENEKDCLKVFDNKGNLIFKKKVGSEIAYNNTQYNDNYITRGLIVDDFNGNGKPEILIGANH